jgi:hypothetical protein
MFLKLHRIIEVEKSLNLVTNVHRHTDNYLLMRNPKVSIYIKNNDEPFVRNGFQYLIRKIKRL